MKQVTIIPYDRAFKKFSLGILCIIIASYIVGGLLYPLPSPINYFFLIGAVLNVGPVIGVYVMPVVYMKKFIKIYFAVSLIPIYIITVICLLKAVVTPLFWFMALPIYIYAVFPSQKTLKWLFGYVCLILSSIALTFILQHTIYDNEFVIYYSLSLYQALLTELFNGFFALLMICYSLYYIHKFHQIEIKELVSSLQHTKVKNLDIASVQTEENYDNDKFEQIYEQIESYLETKEPYLNPDFRIAQMAFELNINVVYLAKAIRYKKGMNFNNLINSYRIERVKKIIENNASKYTIEYIYLSSGFKSQSSFNRTFKLYMNITPSEYYKMIDDSK